MFRHFKSSYIENSNPQISWILARARIGITLIPGMMLLAVGAYTLDYLFRTSLANQSTNLFLPAVHLIPGLAIFALGMLARLCASSPGAVSAHYGAFALDAALLLFVAVSCETWANSSLSSAEQVRKPC